jgi:hypothetical protein
MKLLTNEIDYEKTIEIAIKLSGNYDKKVIYHCYWNGDLNEKHLGSIKSCYYFNVKNKINKKIILWIENNNNDNLEFKKYAEIKQFQFDKNFKMTKTCYKGLSYYSDIVRYIILYNYGGCWFDLDILFLRCIEPLFFNFENEIIVYQWEKRNWPNGAIYISLSPKNEKMENNIKFITKRNIGWGFLTGNLTYEMSLDLLVLPCSWFDGGWISNPYNIKFNIFNKTEKEYTFDNFFKGSFCFHWHNQWDVIIEENSIFEQLINLL